MKPSLFQYVDYREYLKAWIESVPAKKRGQLARISEAASIHKTALSQIFAGTKELSLEQAEKVTKYLGLTDAETEYFVLLVNYSRAGTASLRELFRQQISARQKNHRQLSSRVSKSRELTGEERSIYYSNWIYSAVRNLSAIEGFSSTQAIAKRLRLDSAILNQVIEFLLRTSLCAGNSGELRPGPQMTHLEASSPLVSRHHGNWRLKAMERHPMLRPDDELAYTAPMTLSAADAARIRSLMADLVQKTDEVVGPSPSEKLYCMCLDWFEVR